MKSDPSVTSVAMNSKSGKTIASSSNCVPRSDLLLCLIGLIAHHRLRSNVECPEWEINELIGRGHRDLRVLQSRNAIYHRTRRSAGAVLHDHDIAVRHSNAVTLKEVLHVRNHL